MPAEPPILMAISDFAAAHRGVPDDWLDALSRQGVDAVQVRAKALPDDQLTALTRRVVEAARGRLRVLVNGRADLAIACGADGVHLPSDGVPAKAIRRRFPSLLLGLSTHRIDEIEHARQWVDYVTFSPIFPTPSKAELGSPQGLDALGAAAAIGVPVLALGGIDAKRLDSVAAAGAAGAAAIRALQDPHSLVEMGARAKLLWRTEASRKHSCRKNLRD